MHSALAMLASAGPYGRLEDLGIEQTKVFMCGVSMLAADRQ